MLHFDDSPPQTFGTVQVAFRFPSTQHATEAAVERLVRAITASDLVKEQDIWRARLCVTEVLQNAVVHGNGRDPNRLVHCRLMADDTHWGLLVQDEGQGFTVGDLPANGPETPDLLAENGRGLLLTAELAAKVTVHRPNTGVFIIAERIRQAGRVESNRNHAAELQHDPSATNPAGEAIRTDDSQMGA